MITGQFGFYCIFVKIIRKFEKLYHFWFIKKIGIILFPEILTHFLIAEKSNDSGGNSSWERVWK